MGVNATEEGVLSASERSKGEEEERKGEREIGSEARQPEWINFHSNWLMLLVSVAQW